MSGFIPINRKIFEHEFWQEKRSFSRFEAWFDMLKSARFEKEERTDWIGGKPITYGRGQWPASVRFLQKRWGWGSIKKVELFLKYLKNGDMISIETETGQSVITICKYESYNPLKNFERQEGDAEETPKRQQRDKANKGNKGNNLNNTSSTGQSPDPKGPVLTDKEFKFLQMFNSTCNREFKTLGDKAKRQFAKLLKNNFTNGDVKTAIKNGYEDSHTWSKPSLFTPEYITREENFEKYLYAVKIIPISAAGGAGEQSLQERLAKQNEKYAN